jgi:starvation-inducible outer membrane lipoprotein
MNNFTKVFFILLAMVLAACGTVSDVVAVNADTYIVSSHGVVGNGAASAEEVKSVKSASVFCQQKSLSLKVLSVEKVDPFFGRAPSASVKFQCL